MFPTQVRGHKCSLLTTTPFLAENRLVETGDHRVAKPWSECVFLRCQFMTCIRLWDSFAG